MSNRQIQAWYARAQIDYCNQYMALYTSFNAWYASRVVAHSDREALNKLNSLRNPIWEAYCQGHGLQRLAVYMTQLAELTQREPLSHSTPHWNGEVAHKKDWSSLLEYWYRVRCLVVHGAEIRQPYVQLAYETLNIFMSEVIRGERR